MAASISPTLVFALALAAGAAALLVAFWNMRLAQRLAAARRDLEQARTALQRERQEHVHAQVAAQTALEGERELLDLKARFVSLVSHEFRTPLGIIMSAAELLRNYKDRLTADNQRELIEDVLASTRRMSALMEQALLLGRVDAGRVNLRIVPVDLHDLIERVCAEQRAVNGARAAIVPHLGQELDGAQADAGVLHHILSNLVSNGVKYSPDGAEVRVSVRRAGSDAVLQIADRGIGIPETDQPRLFEAFHRASNVGDIAGSGLGLLIVKRCVDLHGGRIEVDSQVGHGTTFTVTLPLFASGQDGDPGVTPDAPRSMASRMVA